MKMKNKIQCILIKILSISTILISFFWFGYDVITSDDFILKLISFIFVETIIIWVSYNMLMRTNNPLSPYNFISIDPLWVGTMKYSFIRDPFQFTRKRQLTSDESDIIISRERDEIIDNILDE